MSQNNNILDEVDRNKGPRTCPECGFQFPLYLFIKRYVMKFGFPKWTCPNCQAFIRYNYSKSNVVGTLIFFACIFLQIGFQSKFGWDLPNFIFIIPYFFIALILLNFDTLKKYKN